MNILEVVLSSLAPHLCVGCGRTGTTICHSCAESIEQPVAACYRCGATDIHFRTCRSCRHSSPLRRVYARAAYQDIAKQLVWKLKFERAQAAATDMTQLMAPLIGNFEGLYIVPLPTATQRVRQRGYDQAVLLARAISKRSNGTFLPALYRHGQSQQHGASRQQRRLQAIESFSVRFPARVQNKRIVLIDDVATTGASLEAAAYCLKRAGARSIDALVFARA